MRAMKHGTRERAAVAHRQLRPRRALAQRSTLHRAAREETKRTQPTGSPMAVEPLHKHAKEWFPYVSLDVFLDRLHWPCTRAARLQTSNVSVACVHAR